MTNVVLPVLTVQEIEVKSQSDSRKIILRLIFNKNQGESVAIFLEREHAERIVGLLQGELQDQSVTA